MVSYLEDTSSLQVYGTAWANVTNPGDITGVAAGTALTGGGTAGDVTLNVNLAAVGSALNITTGTAGFTALSNGTAGITYQPVSHNYIINGAFDIWQRGTSFSLAAFDPRYTADRWYQFNGQAFTISQETSSVPTGSVNALKLTGGATASAYTIWQPIETLNAIRLAGQTVTFSAFVSGTTGRDARLLIETSTTTNDIQVGGGYTNLLASPSVTLTSGTYSRITLTATIPANARSIRTLVQFGAVSAIQSGEIGLVANTQLEAGSVATPFNRNANSIQGELAACQRYFQAYGGDAANQFFGSGLAVSTTVGAFSFLTQTSLRSAPSITFSNVTHFSLAGSTGALIACTNLTANNAATSSVGLTGTVASGLVAGNGSLLRANTTDARIFASAEL
jgi:hypothetical protein